MTAHATLSASASSRWLNCPGSIRLTKDIPNKSSGFSRHGSAAHELAEMCLRKKQDAEEHRGLAIRIEHEDFTVDQEMISAVQQYLDFVRSIEGEELQIEQRVNYSPWAVPESFGTADAVVIDWENRHLTICDLKFGTGVKVEAEQNTQLMLYALGCINEYGHLGQIDTVTLAISQPRIDHVSEWEIPTANLLTWGERIVRPTAEIAMTEDAPIVPGDKQCRWCAIAATCSASAEHHMMVVQSGFDDLTAPVSPPQLDRLSLEQQVYVARNQKAVTGWMNKIEKHLFDLALQGKDIPGMKMVEGRSIRKWDDEAAVDCQLEDLQYSGAIDSEEPFYVTKLISPTQAEKLMGKPKFAELLSHRVVKPQGKPTLVADSDKRQPLNLATALGFEDIS
jgi:hypothetical protein